MKISHSKGYEWLHPNKVKYWYAEEERVYELYKKARNSTDYILRAKWFDLWLEYLQYRNMTSYD
jgi:hypothetical protein